MEDYEDIDDELENINEASLGEDEYIEEETDVVDIANSNKALLNALIHTLAEKGIINEDELLAKASSDDLPDYSVEDSDEDLESL